MRNNKQISIIEKEIERRNAQHNKLTSIKSYLREQLVKTIDQEEKHYINTVIEQLIEYDDWINMKMHRLDQERLNIMFSKKKGVE